MTFLEALDYTSVFVFALTGALVASRAQFDLIGFAFIAALTGVGGGTLRDLLLNRDPIFWIAEPKYLAVTSAAALLVFLTAHFVESRLKLLLWLDSLALGVAVAAGTGIALKLGYPPAIVVLMGMITGCMGGLMRDVVVGDVPVVLKQGELYVSAAFAGAGSALIADQAGLPPLITCAIVTWILRAGSLVFGWRLPVYKSRAPKP